MKLRRFILVAWFILIVDGHHIIAESSKKHTIVGPGTRIDYGDMSLQLINDFVMLIQIFITCVPSGPLAPILVDFVRMSCLFQMLSTFSLLSLNILEGWDKLDESRAFKIQMRRMFNNWAERNEKRNSLDGNVNWQVIKDWVRIFDIHFEMYVSNYSDIERNGARNRVICASLGVGRKSLIGIPFEQEICVTKKGVRKLGENRFSALSANTTRQLIRFLVNGGFFKAINNPPFYLFRILRVYGDMAVDFLETLQEMTTLLQMEADTSLERACYFHEGEYLLMLMRLRSRKIHRLVDYG